MAALGPHAQDLVQLDLVAFEAEPAAGHVQAPHAGPADAGLGFAAPPPPDLAAVESARQATVTIRVPGADGEEEAIGAGFVHEGSRKIVTNAHVVGNRDTLRIGLADGRIIEARVAGRDPVADIALVEADIDPTDIARAREVNPSLSNRRIRTPW